MLRDSNTGVPQRGAGYRTRLVSDIRPQGLSRAQPDPRRPHRIRAVRAPVDTIPAPLFPRDMTWLNVASLRMEKQRGRPVLVEFWDCCRVQSLRTLPYVKAWHERYADAGLRVISIHAPGFASGQGRGIRPRGDRAPRHRARRPARPGLRHLEALREPGLARALPLQPDAAAAFLPLRRGRVRRDRAGDPGAAWRRRASRRAAAPRGRSGGRDRRADHRAAGCLQRAVRGRWRVGRRRGRGHDPRRRRRAPGRALRRAGARRRTSATRPACWRSRAAKA